MHWEGVEPSTAGFVDRSSVQLSYQCVLRIWLISAAYNEARSMVVGSALAVAIVGEGGPSTRKLRPLKRTLCANLLNGRTRRGQASANSRNKSERCFRPGRTPGRMRRGAIS